MNNRNCLFSCCISVVVKTILSLVLLVQFPLHTIASPERHIALDGQSNFRDIGGYETEDGRLVKWDRVYRTGELPRLSDKDVTRLEKLGIKTVVNFLSEDEIKARGKDRLPTGVEEVFLPISGEAENDLAKVVLEARQTADFSKVPVELNYEVHRILTGDAAREQYASLLRLAADPANHPLVYHCSHGVHRTGTATAILLSVLGVPWETVREDYLLSNKYRKAEVQKRIAELRDMAAKRQGLSPDQVDMSNINAFYVLEAAYIDATLDEINKEYGSLDRYVREGLGLSDAEVQQLRDALLD